MSPSPPTPAAIRGVLLDLDGTVYAGQAEVPGAARFIQRLRRDGLRYCFVTNRANRVPEEVCAQLRGYGIPCEPSDVLTSAQATALHLRRGSAFCIGEDGLRRALEEAGIVVTDRNPDYVIVSLDRRFNYEKLRTACRLIRGGARYIATNPDRGLPSDGGIEPGAGAILAAVTTGSGAQPLVIGKPEPRILELALEKLGLRPAEALNVGDNLETDVPAGLRAGIRTVLLLTGVSRRADLARAPAQPTWVAESYADLERLLDEAGGKG